MAIGGVSIRRGDDCFVIAEIGHNHQGQIEKCHEMFRVAHECGANAVKLQKRDNRGLYTKEMYDSAYIHRNSYGATYGEHREALEFGKSEYLELKAHAEDLGIVFFATAFDRPSADFLMDIGLPAIKVASGDLTNTPLLDYLSRLGVPLVVSTGGGTMEDVERAYDIVAPNCSDVCLMQCTSGYPAAFDELDLRVVETFASRFPDWVPGLSSHDNGIAMALVAYTLGASVVEKHFTLNRTAKGTDHSFSLTPEGLRRLVRDLRRANVALGNGTKRRHKSEEAPLYKMAKKIVAARDLPANHTLTAADMAVKTPNDGIPPYELDNLVGRKLRTPLLADDALAFSDLE
jgi:sialic acid synthase